MGVWNGCLASEDVAYGSVPMANASPCSDRPDFILTDHSRAKLPCAKFSPYLGKASNDLVHGRALRGIFLDHVGDEWFNEFEPVIFLILMKSGYFSFGNQGNHRPGCNPPEPNFRGSKHRWEMDCTVSCRPGVPVQIYPRHALGRQVWVHW